MKENFYPLGNVDNKKIVKFARIIFGLICLSLAAFWAYFNMKSGINTNSNWVTLLFLVVFGIYLIMAGSGKTDRFIRITKGSIRLKKNSLLPPVELLNDKIERIQFFPLSISFLMKEKNKILLRFGTVNYETNEKIVDSLIDFAEENNIPYEMMKEEMNF